jgi:ATP-dependent Lon protease
LDEHLFPEAIKNAGLNKEIHSFTFTEKVKDHIISNYCREPGVRSLKKYMNRIAEKIAF